MAATAACRKGNQGASTPPAGAPPAFGTTPETGPAVSAATFAEAEKLLQAPMTPADRELTAGSWLRTLAYLNERRTGSRKIALEPELAPATRWDPVLPGMKAGPDRDRFVRSTADPGPLPANDADIAFAPLTRLARWVETRKVSSERLTDLYLDRIQRFDPKLRCVITVTRELALTQARKADAEIAAGKYDVCPLWHSRFQFNHLAIHGEPAVSVVVHGLRSLLRGIGPGLEHFKDEDLVLGDETGIDYLTFEIGEALCHERRRHALGWRRSQTESPEFLHVPA